MANANIHRCHLHKSSLAAWINFEVGLYFEVLHLLLRKIKFLNGIETFLL